MIVTINPSVQQPGECEHVDVKTVLMRFKKHDKNGLQELRDLDDPDEQQKRKVKLPVVVFGGKFSERNNSGLIQASGLMVLDFDCYSEQESEKIRSQLSGDPFIYAYFRSTRGFGYKALVRIPSVKDDASYKQIWNSVEKRYPNVDPACKDIARACFFTYDPDLVYNPDAKVWSKKDPANVQRASKKVSRSTNYSLINKALNVIRRATEGERHNKILAASRLCGGWIAANKIDYQEAQRLLEQEARAVNPSDEPRINKQAVEDGLEHGMRDPLDEDQFFREEKIEQKFEKIYWTLNDVEDSVTEKFKEGLSEGYKSGYTNLDELYRLHLGYTTYIYGPAFSGKSLVWFDLLKNYSYRYGMRHVVFSPESGSADDVHIKLIELVAGGNFYDTGYGKMSLEEMEEAKKFVNQHFIVIDPGLETMTLDDLIASTEMIERVFNTKIHTLTIDPWNDLHHDMSDFNYRDDQYLEKQLRKSRVVAHLNNWHITIITHTRDQAFEGKGEKKYQPPATFREVAGGQAWSRRGFMMSSIWRPPSWMEEFDGKELEGNETFWFQQKYKPEWAGSRGKASLKYDASRKRFYTGNSKLKNYANLNPDPDQKAQDKYDSGYNEEEAPF